MKAFIDEYLNAIMYTICGILLILGSYNILINVNHLSFINKRVVVSDIDINYQKYKDNIVKIENNLSHYQGSRNRLYNALTDTLKLLKKDGVYQLMPGDKLSYGDLYRLNNYYLDTIINTGWFERIKNNYDGSQNEMVNYLISNAKYLNDELLNNSNFQYEVKNNEIRNSLNAEYQFLLSNYEAFSSILLNISKGIGD